MAMDTSSRISAKNQEMFKGKDSRTHAGGSLCHDKFGFESFSSSTLNFYENQIMIAETPCSLTVIG